MFVIAAILLAVTPSVGPVDELQVNERLVELEAPLEMLSLARLGQIFLDGLEPGPIAEKSFLRGAWGEVSEVELSEAPVSHGNGYCSRISYRVALDHRDGVPRVSQRTVHPAVRRATDCAQEGRWISVPLELGTEGGLQLLTSLYALQEEARSQTLSVDISCRDDSQAGLCDGDAADILAGLDLSRIVKLEGPEQSRQDPYRAIVTVTPFEQWWLNHAMGQPEPRLEMVYSGRIPVRPPAPPGPPPRRR